MHYAILKCASVRLHITTPARFAINDQSSLLLDAVLDTTGLWRREITLVLGAHVHVSYLRLPQ
jgi:hypothetical protein